MICPSNNSLKADKTTPLAWFCGLAFPLYGQMTFIAIISFSLLLVVSCAGNKSALDAENSPAGIPDSFEDRPHENIPKHKFHSSSDNNEKDEVLNPVLSIELYEKGIEAYVSGDKIMAATLWEEAIKRDPENKSAEAALDKLRNE